tara:strand:- start:1457 stop:3634 length:2178 start_codon:yes stop_codon:yes gene_type:complete
MTRYAKTMSEALQEVSRAESNKVNAQLSKILGKIRFTHIYNQKGGIFKLPSNVKHEVTVDRNDMKDAAALLMKDKGDVGFMFKQGQIRLVPAMRVSKKEEADYPHKMYDPKTGKSVVAKTPDDHDKYSKMGYTHTPAKLDEDGHSDVASAMRQCKTITEDATQIDSKLQTMSPEDSLPTWWTNKLAVSSNSMNKLRDYFLVPVTEETLVEKDIKILVKDVKDRNFLKDLLNKSKDEKVMVGSPTPADKRAGRYVFVGPKDKVNNVFNYAFDKSIKRGVYDPATMMHEEIELDEAIVQKYVLINMQGKVQGYASDKRDAMDIARRTKSTMHPIKKKVTDKTLEKMNALAKTPKELKDLGIIEETELDEMSYKPGSFKDTRPQEKGAKAFDKLIQSGGIDKKTFQKAKQLYVQASDPKSRMKLRDFIYNMDTEPLEAVMDLIGRNDPETFVRMYPDADEGERLSTISFRHKQKRIKTEELDDEDIPKVKKIIGKLKKASDAHAGQAKDLQKAIDEKGKEMSEKLTDGNLSLKDTVLKMWKEAKNPAQQAAIAIAKKEKEKKEEPDEGNLFGKKLKDARDKGEKTFTIAGKTYDVEKEEKKLDPVNPKAVKKKFADRKDKDIDNDGDVDDTDKFLHKRRKAISKAINKEDVEHQRQRYLETKRGSLRDAVLQMWGEDAHSKKDDEEKKKNLTKEQEHGKKKMTDTGKEMTPVDMKPKMPKIKNEKNKV